MECCLLCSFALVVVSAHLDHFQPLLTINVFFLYIFTYISLLSFLWDYLNRQTVFSRTFRSEPTLFCQPDFFARFFQLMTKNIVDIFLGHGYNVSIYLCSTAKNGITVCSFSSKAKHTPVNLIRKNSFITMYMRRGIQSHRQMSNKCFSTKQYIITFI